MAAQHFVGLWPLLTEVYTSIIGVTSRAQIPNEEIRHQLGVI
jgi:hypothetical protein